MKKITLFPLFFVLIFLASCSQQAPKSEATQAKPAFEFNKNMPKELIAGLEAHGGLKKWSEMRTLEFSIPKKESQEVHLTDLYSRKALIKHEDYTLGWNGQDAWVTPSKEAFGKTPPRFYYNLVFYFHAMPFLLADPGINYEVLPNKEFEGKMYYGVKVTYNGGVGDSPEDIYIAYFDINTHQMRYLLYTVTYFSGEKNENYHLLVYDEWEDVEGVLLPKVMKGYKYENGEIGDMRYERPFSDIRLSKASKADSYFEVPADGVIDSLIIH